MSRMPHGLWLLGTSAISALLIALWAPSYGAATPQPTRLTVVRCATVYGLPRDQYRVPSVPAVRVAKVTPEVARRIVFYSNGWVTLLAPRGWHCAGIVGATGARFLKVLPPNVKTPPAGFSDVPRRAAAVTAYIPSPETGEVGGVACSFFPEASPAPGGPCPAASAGERVSRLSADAVAFEDPPHVAGSGDPSGGPYPANGVVIYSHHQAATATCTLPQSRHRVCTSILNDFLVRSPF